MRKLFLLSILGFILYLPQLQAQILNHPVNTALGGGGTAYTTGYTSLYVNPANLMIKERDYRLQVSALTGGSYLSLPIANSDFQFYRSEYRSQLRPYRERREVVALSPSTSGNGPGQDDVVNRNYNSGKQLSEHQVRGELHWFGVAWQGENRSYSVGARSRFGNRFEVGRNFYDPAPSEEEGRIEFDQSHTQFYQILHEISFGYAERFEFLSGQLPNLSQFYIGFAPKFILSGSYLEADYKNLYRRDADDSRYERHQAYHQHSSGVYSDFNNRFIAGQTIQPSDIVRTELMRPTGFGAGLDVGLTYVITLGSDLSTLPVFDEQARNTLRLSFSITDIGFVSYRKNPEEFTLDEERGLEDDLPATAGRMFLGRPGEQLYFLNQQSPHPLLHSNRTSGEPFTILLPTSINGGALLQISRFKLMGDITLGITDSAFHATRFATYLGTEIRPLTFLPIRAGTRIALNLPDYYSLGAGIETRYMDLNAAIQLRSRSVGPTNELAGFALGALTFYIP